MSGIVPFATESLPWLGVPSDWPGKVRQGEPDVRYKVLTEPGLVVVHVVVPRAEEAAPTAEAAAAEGTAAAEPEVIKKGKAEAEGEEKAEAKPEKKEKEKK